MYILLLVHHTAMDVTNISNSTNVVLALWIMGNSEMRKTRVCTFGRTRKMDFHGSESDNII